MDIAKIRGALLGQAVGDALGVPVEFSSREERRLDPVKGMREFGCWKQPSGTWSDDTSMALCLMESLTEMGFDIEDQGFRFLAWSEEAKWTARGEVFDIGMTTSNALYRFQQGKDPSGATDPRSNGNGSLMRTLPLSIWQHSQKTDNQQKFEQIHSASAITHGHSIAQMGCGLHYLLTSKLLKGWSMTDAHYLTLKEVQAFYGESEWEEAREAYELFLDKSLADCPESDIKSGGYVVDTLTAASWCLLRGQSFQETTLAAINLGGDTDTTGVVCGGLAGILYGVDSIPKPWISELARLDDIEQLILRFYSVLRR
jgi:ADP-ribosyl-[dinitrogen reductase] hydrolase